MYAAGVLVSVVLALLLPMAARAHVALLVAVRVVQGLAEVRWVRVRLGWGAGVGMKVGVGVEFPGLGVLG